jgi:hypothetical protein
MVKAVWGFVVSEWIMRWGENEE